MFIRSPAHVHGKSAWNSVKTTTREIHYWFETRATRAELLSQYIMFRFLSIFNFQLRNFLLVIDKSFSKQKRILEMKIYLNAARKPRKAQNRNVKFHCDLVRLRSLRTWIFICLHSEIDTCRSFTLITRRGELLHNLLTFLIFHRHKMISPLA